MSSRRAVFPAACVLLAGCAAVGAAIVWMCGGDFSYTLDDPYIHLALAENLAAGHYGIDPSEPSAPSSSILWPFLLAPFARTAFAEWWPLVLALASALATLPLAHRALAAGLDGSDPRRRAAASVLLVCVVLATNMVGLVFTGMEHSLQVLMTVAAVAGVLELERRGAPPAWLAPVLVVGPLVRYENLAVSGPALVLLLWRGHWRQAFAAGAAVGVLVGAFSLFLESRGLGFLPSSVLAKALGGGLERTLENLVDKLRGPRCLMFLLVGVGLPLWILRQRARRADRPLALFALAIAVLHFLGGEFGWWGRYEQYAWAAVLLLAAYLCRDTIARLAAHRRAAALAAAAIVASFLPYSREQLRTPAAAHGIYRQQYQMHRFVTELWKAPVAVNDLGWVAWGNPHYVLDLYGLGSIAALRHRKAKDDPRWMDDLARQRGVELVMIYDRWIRPRPPTWVLLGMLVSDPPMYSALGPEVSFYATGAEAAARARPLLEELRGRLPRGASFRPARP